MSVAARDDALVHEELGSRRRSTRSVLLGHAGAGTGSAMVPHAPAATSSAPERSPRMIAAMLLAIDIGNSNVTIGLFRNGALRRTRRAATIAHAHGRRAGAPARRRCCASMTRRSPTSRRSRCASVVPGLTAALEAVAARRERPLPRRRRGHGPARRSGSTVRARSAPTAWSTRLPRHASTARRPSWSTSARRRRSTASPPTARSSAGPSRRASSSGSRHWRRGPRSCPGSNCAAPDRAIGRDTVGDPGGTSWLPGAGDRAPRAGPRASSPTATASHTATSTRSSPAGSRRRPGRGSSTASRRSIPT